MLYVDHQRSMRYHEREEAERQAAEERQQAFEQRRAEERVMTLKAEVARQAEMTGEPIDIASYDGPLPEVVDGHYTSVFPDRLLILPIAGINYRSGIKPYVGDFRGVLVPEPKNDYDPNAIMVKCEDGHHLGYVAESETAIVRRLVGEDFKRHRITGHIDQIEEDDGYDDKPRTYFSGHIYVAKP